MTTHLPLPSERRLLEGEIRQWFDTYIRLPCWQLHHRAPALLPNQLEHVRRQLNERLTFRWTDKPPRVLGTYHTATTEIKLTLYPGVTHADLIETILHELVHAAGYGHAEHGLRFYTMLGVAAQSIHVPGYYITEDGDLTTYLRERGLYSQVLVPSRPVRAGR